MPLPKVPGGQKLSLVLPSDMVRRIKLEALDSGVLPNGIVQKALAGYWRDDSADSATGQSLADAPSADTPLSSRGLPIPLRQMKQLAVMDAMLAEGRFTEQEFTTALGKTPSALRAEWIKNKTGPLVEVVKIEKFIASKCISREGYLALIEVMRVPGDDSSAPR